MSNIPKKIAFAIITSYPKWYRGKLRSIKHTDKVRGDLAIEFFTKAVKSGYRVVVADGRSSKTFKKELGKITNLILIKRRKLNPIDSKLQAIKKASRLEGIEVIVLTEAEKVSLLNSIQKITEPVLEKNADIVIPRRDPDLFKKTYPSYMYESEMEGNVLYNEILRTTRIIDEKLDFDFFFGPRAFSTSKEVLKLFTKTYRLKIGKVDYRHLRHFTVHSFPQYFPIIQALKMKLEVKDIVIDFSYPQLQKENEEKGNKVYFKDKRTRQRMEALLELLIFLNYLVKS